MAEQHYTHTHIQREREREREKGGKGEAKRDRKNKALPCFSRHVSCSVLSASASSFRSVSTLSTHTTYLTAALTGASEP